MLIWKSQNFNNFNFNLNNFLQRNGLTVDSFDKRVSLSVGSYAKACESASFLLGGKRLSLIIIFLRHETFSISITTTYSLPW